MINQNFFLKAENTMPTKAIVDITTTKSTAK